MDVDVHLRPGGPARRKCLPRRLSRDSLPVLTKEMSSPGVRVGCIACQAAKGFAGAAFCGGAPARLDLV